ncbi:MAG: hypothetical protein K0Q72_1297 [Armatimonadetes bacterium]|nr:hypothetical protein [Armatimonadota bacterium]
MSLWHDLITTALVGTERQAPPAPEAGTPLGDALAGLERREPAAALLSAAGAASLYERAGRLPSRDARPAPVPAEPDAQPTCSPRSAQHLELMLSGTHAAALPEWLGLAVRRGFRVPERLLPELLQAGRQSREFREPILQVAGKRGRWLAAQNPEWNYLAIEDEEEASWETGSRAARQVVFGRMRAADPDQARELLAQSWAQEPADERSGFLGAFKDGLSLADEPFLEAALDDRSKGVRATAADLLARLPGSALGARMRDRVLPLVSVRTSSGLLGLGQTTQIELTLPDECDKAMVRDGVEPKPPQHDRRFGEKAWWLVQLLAAVPPRTWSEAAGARPEEVLQAAVKSEWKELLVEAWAIAAERSADAEWAEALLLLGDTRADAREGLVALIPTARREQLLIQLLERGQEALDPKHPALQMLQQCRHAWSPELARAVLAALGARLAGKPKSEYALSELLVQWSLYMPPSLADEAAQGTLSETESYWPERINRMTSMLQFRREMLEEMQR